MRAMVSRRKFLGMLAALPAITALAGSALRLPPRKEMDGDFDTANLRYKASERYSEAWTSANFSNQLSTRADLSEKSLDDMLKQMRQFIEHPPPFAVRPTKVIVHPDMYEAAHYALTHRPTLLERFLWRLFPVD